MIDNYKVGNQIALLRKSKGLTGESFAELLDVSPQAVSKWENGKCLPETALLPLIAETLGTSIDALLMPQELIILNAVFTDGVTAYDVTRILNHNINGNKLYMAVNSQYMGISIDNNRVKVITVKYQTPGGIYYAYMQENQYLSINITEEVYKQETDMKIIGAFYGNKDDYRDCMVKIQHYDYFNWEEIYVNHESFPSSPKTDEKEYLTLIYINKQGIHVISCEENETLCYSKDKTSIYLKDTSFCILPGIEPLEWEKGMDCTWAGAVLRAVNYMGEAYTYEQIMGMSGACYRIAFTDLWDWSAVDALVAYDYSTPLFQAIGYEQIWADRISKEERSEERKRIVKDIMNGKPVIAINLRIAPEWGVITGFKENGKVLLCRTYFDKEFLNDTMDYLESDFWPFAIAHFGKKTEKASDYDTLTASLRTLIASFHSTSQRGYYQGKEAYEHWIKGLLDDSLWTNRSTSEEIERRIGVNDATLLNLIDARRCAACYLHESISLLPGDLQEKLKEIAEKYYSIADKLTDYRKVSNKEGITAVHYNEIYTSYNSGAEFRKRQVELLKNVLMTELSIAEATAVLLENMQK